MTRPTPVVTTVEQSAWAAEAALSVADANTSNGDDYFQEIQVCSTDAGAVTFLARTQTVVMRFPLTVNWKEMGFVVPLAEWMREQFHVSPVIWTRWQVRKLVHEARYLEDERPSGRDDFSKFFQPSRFRETLTRLNWPYEYPDEFKMGVGKTDVSTWSVRTYPLLCDPQAFDARREAVLGLLGEVTAPLMEALSEVWSLAQVACPGATVQYSTARVEDAWVYFFDVMHQGVPVADGLVDPAL